MIKIIEFQGEYRWLSNFWPCPIVLDGIEYQSVEHAYMSAKCDEKSWKMLCADFKISAGAIKRKSRGIRLVEDWEEIKIPTMPYCLRQKFNQEPFRTQLIDTGEAIIEEGNHWGDKFWGVCLRTKEGRNELGKLIMKIRENLK